MVQTVAIQDTKFTFVGGSSADSLTAASTLTQAAALALTSQTNRVTSGGAGYGVALPQVVGSAGAWNLKGVPVTVINATAFDLAVYPAYGAGDTINGLASTAPVTIPAGAVATFIGATGFPTAITGNWYMNLTAGSGGAGGVVTVAAAGATQGTATAIPATAQTVNVTVTASTEGVKLPTAVTGRQVTLLTPTTKGYKVYAAAAGQTINAATTATTAYAMTTNHPATFYAVSATKWQVQRGN